MTAAGSAPAGSRFDRAVAAVLLVAAAVAAAALLLPWARVTGSPIPDSADVAQEQVDRAGSAEEFTVDGSSGVAGALLLTLCAVLVVLALWRLSPSYRPTVAGYLTTLGAILGAAGVAWFLLDEQRRADLFGAAVQVQSDTMTVTVWPWVALGGFAVAGAAGVLLVPGRGAAGIDAGM